MPTARNAERVDTPSAAIPVAEGEEPWTADELAEVREELTGEVAREDAAQETLMHYMMKGSTS